MKKILCITLAVFFYILGIIGLILPVIPQVPFFIIGTIFASIASKKIKNWILNSRLYNHHLKEKAENSRLFNLIFKD